MSPLEAAFHLYSSTPSEKITTHSRVFVERCQGRRMDEIPPDLAREVELMLDNGETLTTIRSQLKMGWKLLDRILVKINRPPVRRGRPRKR